MRSRPTLAVILFAAVAALVPAPVSSAQPERESNVPLLRGVPADVHFFTHGVTPKSPDPASEAFSRAASRFVESGAHRDLARLLMLRLPADARAQAAAAADEAFRLVGAVDWSLLIEKEVAFAFKLGMPFPEYLFLFRVPPDRAAEEIAALGDCIRGLVRLGGAEVAAREAERTTGKMTVLSMPGGVVEIALASVGDALVVSTNVNLAATSMSKLAGGTDDGTVLGKEAVARATAGLPQVRDSVEYFDVRAFFSFVLQSLAVVSATMHANESAAVANQFIGLASAILQEMDCVEGVATAYASDGKSLTTTSRVLMRPEAQSSRFLRVFSKQEPWTDWVRRVPRDATAFSFEPGLDLAALYDFGVEMLKENVSASGEILAQWDAIQSRMGFRLREDVLSCVSGESASVSFPALEGGCALGECVTFLKLERPDAVAAALKDGLGLAARYVTGRGQEMAVLDSEGGLHEIRVAAFPWIAPLVGVRGNELIFATSKAALARIDRVSLGEERNVLSDPRFAELGVGRSQGRTISIGYSRLEASGEPIASIFTGVGFFLALLPEEPETEGPILAGRLIGKIGAALREIDFRADVASEVHEAADGSVVTRSVLRFR